VLALATLTTGTGCADRPDVGEYDSYVALGDSFTSGAGLPRPARADSGCAGSELSYPHLVAEAVAAPLRDVSCGGASTQNGARPQGAAPPQLDAVDLDTQLVTVGMGANDFGWYLDVMFACTTVAPSDPAGSPCAERSAGDLTALPPRIGRRVEALLDEVRRRAPDARVLLVGYPQPVPEDGTCAELPLAAGDYAFVRDQWEALDDALRAAAERSGATFVDVRTASEGHDICAGSDAWVSGSTSPPGEAAPYHPTVDGQAGLAELVVAALRT